MSAAQASGALLPPLGALLGSGEVLLPAAVALPWLAAAAVFLPRWRRRLPVVAPWLAVPALLIAIGLPPGTESRLTWILLDVRLGLDETGLVFLRFSAAIWLLAGIYARGYLRADPAAWRFFAFWLVAAGANAGLLLAGDMVTFYLFFGALGIACYGLIFHDRTPRALRAARIYLTYVLVGDALLFAALVLIARRAGGLAFPATTGIGPVSIALLVAGLGVKFGAVPLHSWLPIAHPAAPIPASAVLSGVVIKSGLFGWLRFMPLGAASFPGWSTGFIAAGVVAVFGAAAIGTLQREPKTALAYSSVSQMGLISVAIGLGLVGPEAWPAARFAILAYATHHAVTKSVLFLGVGTVTGSRNRTTRNAALAVTGVAAAALAGFPFTGGAAAKAALKAAEAAAEAGGLHAAWLPLALSLGAAATAVLMGRVLWLLAGAPAARPKPRSTWVAWGALCAALVVMPIWPIPGGSGLRLLRGGDVWSALWPVTLGAAVALLLWRVAWRDRTPGEPTVPPGDLLVPAARGAGAAARAAVEAGTDVRRIVRTRAREFHDAHTGRHGAGLRTAWERADRFVRRWPGFGALIALTLLALIALWQLAGA